MTQLNQRKTVSNICSKGFVEKKGGSHRAFNYMTLEGKRSSITTHVSRSPQHKVLTDALIAAMAKQCRINKNEFVEFAECSIDQYAYESILRANHQL